MACLGFIAALRGGRLRQAPERSSIGPFKPHGRLCGRQAGRTYTPPVPTHPDFASHCADLLAPAGVVRTRRMFGGYGLYIEEVFVAAISGDSLYLKTDDRTQPLFAGAGGAQFCFNSRGKLQATHFW